MMERYGPITNLWEGGMMGEKFSQELKPRLRGGLTRNWHVNVLKDVLKKMMCYPEWSCLQQLRK